MAITAENTNYTSATTTVSPTFVIANLRLSSVPDRFLAVTVVTRSNTNSATQVVWQPNGDGTGQQFLTLIQGVNHASQNLRVELWGLVAPTATVGGTAASRVAVAWSVAGDNASIGVTEFAGVHQTTPWPGYPSAYSSTDQSASPLVSNTTATLAVTSVAGNLVLGAIAKDVSVNSTGTNGPTDRINTASAGMRDYFNRLAPSGGGATPSAHVHGAMVTSLASGVTTNLSYTFLQTSGGALNGRSYVQIGVPLSQSTSVAPYYVAPPSVEIRLNGVNFAGAAVPTSNNTAFSTAGVVTIGPQPQNVTNTRVGTYSSKVSATQSTFNFSASGGGSFNTGELVYESLLDYPGTVPGTTATARIPSTAAADDIAIVAVYSEDEVFDIQPAIGGAFTAIQTTDVAGGTPYRLRTFYRRLIGGDISTSFTFNTSTASGDRRELLVAIYRGCVTTGSPIGATTAAPTSATGTSTTPTATGLTTTQADMTVVMVTGTLDNRVTTAPSTLDERLEHGRRIWMADSAVLTASATGSQAAIVSPSTTWGAQLFALIPVAGGTEHTKGAATTQTRSTIVERRGSTYPRAAVKTTASMSMVARRLGSTYRRVAAQTTAARTMTVDKTVSLIRRATTTIARSMVARRLGSTYRRTVTRTASGISHSPFRTIIPFVGTVFNRAAAITLARSTIVRRLGSTYTRRPTQSRTITLVVRRQGSTYRRTRARTGSIALVARRPGSTYRRAVARVGSGVLVVTRQIISGAISFFNYGQPNEHVLQVIDPAHYPGYTFYWEASFRSSTTLVVYCHLFNVTTGLVVAGSEVATSAPHDLVQVVRSGPITLTAGTYRARFGHASGHSVIPGEARLVGETTL